MEEPRHELLALVSEAQRARFDKHGWPAIMMQHGAYYVSGGLGIRVVCLGCGKRFDVGGFPNHVKSQRCKRRQALERAKDELAARHIDELYAIFEDSIFEDKAAGRQEVIERLAALEHEQWAHWTRHMIQVLDAFLPPLQHTLVHGDDGEVEAAEAVCRWFRQMETPYAELSEKEKDSDREWAEKVIAHLFEIHKA